MKVNIIAGFFALTGMIAVFSGCKKVDYEGGAPKVAMESVTMSGPDSVIIRGHVLSIGEGAIAYTGFCYGTDPLPAVQENQVFEENTDTAFQVKVAVKQDSTYFFRFFAANDMTYTVSDPMKFTVPHAKPAIAPCSLTDQEVDAAGSTYTVNSAHLAWDNSGVSGWQVTVNMSGADMYLTFGRKKPANGIYNSSDVTVEYVNFNRYVMEGGDDIYVAENPDKSITITFCSLHFTAGNTRFTMFGKIKTT